MPNREADLGAERMEAMLVGADARIRRAFEVVIRELKGRIDLDALADLIAQGRMQEAIDELEAAANALGVAVNREFVNAADVAAEFLSRAGVVNVAFDTTNWAAVEAMRSNTLRLVTNFTAEQVRATQAALLAGVEAGTNPVGMARRFRDSVGLTETQVGHVNNYRRLLERAGTGVAGQGEALDRALRDARFDPSIERANRTQRPLTAEQVDRMVGRYSERYVKYRAEVIARTEALRAVHEGTEATFQQAIDRGVIDAEDLVRAWNSSRDGRVRDSHRHLNGMKRAFKATFPGLAGPIRYPGDPDAPAAETVQCRCLLTTRLKASKG